MKRLLIPVAIVAALVCGVLLVRGSGAHAGTSGRFAVIFDNARGLTSGQLVKIAGAQAGTVENVSVTPDSKARIEATVDRRFLPFHRDATCTIRASGLIAENYVECDPGTRGSPPLTADAGSSGDGGVPTVPVSRTTEPVTLTDLFSLFNLPARERLTVLISELGIGTAARGEDFNVILRRVNPTLSLARSTIGLLLHQQRQLTDLVTSMDTIAAEAASHTGDIRRFVDRASALTTLTASHRGALAAAVNRLPALLASAQPALRRLDTVAADGTPLVQQIGAAVPALNRTERDLGPFVAAAKPGLSALSAALAKATPAIRDTSGLVTTLRAYADRARSGTGLAADLFSNLQRHGFVESFFSVAYYISTALSRFDTTSHLLSVLLEAPNSGNCLLYAETPVAGCSAHIGAPASSAARTAHVTRSAARGASTAKPPRNAGTGRSAPRPTAPAAAQSPAGAAPAPAAGSPPASPGPPAPAPANLPASTASQLRNLLNYLIK